jgi:hypothetical protein
VLPPTLPRRAAAIVPSPSAATPLLIVVMSGRTQCSSLIFWLIVMSPKARSEQASAPITNGTISSVWKLSPTPGQAGSPKTTVLAASAKGRWAPIPVPRLTR